MHKSLGSRCYYPILEGCVKLHGAIFRLLSNICTKFRGSLQNNSFCSGLANTVLVLLATFSVSYKAVSTFSKGWSTFPVQRRKIHQGLENLHLHAWLLSGIPSKREIFFTEQPSVSQGHSDNLKELFMTPNGKFSVLGISWNNFILFHLLCNSKRFFSYILEEISCTSSNIKGYRSTIARTTCLSGWSDFGDNEFLSFMI